MKKLFAIATVVLTCGRAAQAAELTRPKAGKVEILPLKDPRVQQNQAYLVIIVLARVVTKLGSLPDVNTKVIENLFASDLSYLQTLYEQLNDEPAQDEDGARAGAGNGHAQRYGFGVVGEA